MTATTQALDERIAELRKELADLQRQRNDLLQQYAARPGEKQVERRLDELLPAITAARSRIEELERARTVAADIETLDVRRKQAEEATALRTEAVRLARRRVAIAEELAVAIDQVGEILERWKAEGDTCWDVVRQIQGATIRSLGVVPEHVSTALRDKFLGTRPAAAGYGMSMPEALYGALVPVLHLEDANPRAIDMGRYFQSVHRYGKGPRPSLSEAARECADYLDTCVGVALQDADRIRERIASEEGTGDE